MFADIKMICWPFRLLLLILVANVMLYPVGMRIGHTCKKIGFERDLGQISTFSFGLSD
jgi:hypothetical protein